MNTALELNNSKKLICQERNFIYCSRYQSISLHILKLIPKKISVNIRLSLIYITLTCIPIGVKDKKKKKKYTIHNKQLQECVNYEK